MTSKKLASIARIIWFFSLALPGLVFYSTSEPVWFGIYPILFWGWLSLFILNFAWVANLFFWEAILELLSEKTDNASLIKSSILATLLSFDTFRYTQTPAVIDTEAGPSPVYGYGWGTVLWFISIFLLLAAVGIRQREIRKDPQLPNPYEWFIPLGFFLVILAIGVSSYFSIQDRIGANSTELKRLSTAAFKRGTVCRAPNPVVNQPIHNFSGVLEVIVMKDNKEDFSRYEIQELLERGVPVVRYAGIDYSIKNGIVLSKTAVGYRHPVAIFNEFYSDATINANLVEVSTNRIVFDQTWQLEKEHGRVGGVYAGYYCPDFNSEKPKLLLLQALSLPETKIKKQTTKSPLHDKTHP